MIELEDENHLIAIQQLIEKNAEKSPNYIAVVDANSNYTYRTMNQKANQLAHYLLDFKLPVDSLIAVAIEPSLQLMLSLIAILKANCGYLPLSPHHPKDRLQFCLQDARCKILMTQSKFKHQFVGFKGQIILIDQIADELTAQSILNPVCITQSENLAYVIYTSGSTGKPKGVMIEHKSIINYILWLRDYSACHSQDKIDFSSSIIFDMAVTTTIAAFCLGLQVVICPEEIKKNVRQYLYHLQKNKINIVKLTPSYFKILLQEAQQTEISLRCLHTIILGGEILLTKECNLWLQIYPHTILYNEYGPTETTVAVTQFKVTDKNVRQLPLIVPIGKPGREMACFILDENLQRVPPLEIGELYVGGRCLARGYLNQPTLTDKKFIDCDHLQLPIKLYKTGDICRYLADGEIEFLQRSDEQVKIRGFRIELAEIETSLNSHPLIKESVVTTQKSARGEAQLIAYYIAKSTINIPQPQQLEAYLQQKIPEYMLPSLYILMTTFPLNDNGKLDKQSLPKPTFNHALTLPHTKIERQLVNIWCEEFMLSDIGVNSNFFELGGHSLLAIRIISEIEKKLNKKISLQEIYKAPTIRQLAKIIQSANRIKRKTKFNLVKKHNRNHLPLSDFQFTFWISNLFEPKVKNLNIVARRRLAGVIDVEALNHALAWVFLKHEILIAEIGKFWPAFYLNKNIEYAIMQKDLTQHTDHEIELALDDSLHKLINTSLWQRKTPLIDVKLYRLRNDCSEIQISVAHICFDDRSEEILFNDLSAAYLHFKDGLPLPPIEHEAQYTNYIFFEKNYLNQNLERDITFWQKYFHDTELAILPREHVINNMQDTPYSTYLELPSLFNEKTHEICTTALISITDLLCATIKLALQENIENRDTNIFINVVRSVREDNRYDNMIGCFLRIDPIKVSANLNLIELAKAIQQSRVEIETHQVCSGMVKLACLDKSYRRKLFTNWIIAILTKIYCKLFSNLMLNSKVLSMYSRLKFLKKKQHFLININLLNNFITQKDNEYLFGYKEERIKKLEYDLSKIDNVLDICIYRNQSFNKNYLVISGNLTPTFRTAFGEKIINIITQT